MLSKLKIAADTRLKTETSKLNRNDNGIFNINHQYILWCRDIPNVEFSTVALTIRRKNPTRESGSTEVAEWTR